MGQQTTTGPTRWQVVLALGAVYLVWGSTYLGIRYAVETLPPFGMAAARFLVAGGALYLWARARGAGRPTAGQWRSAGIVGLLLLLGGNGGVVWAEQSIPSSLAALLISTVPLFMALLEWIFEGRRPTPAVAAGLLVGFAGVALLVGPSDLGGAATLVPAVVVTLSALSWTAGSFYARRSPPASSPLLGTAMQMLAGGAALLVVSIGTGEVAAFDPAAASARSVLALAYLIVFGSLVGFTAYVWLLRNVQPALASTYAYVNPAVAVLLGWALAGEAIGPRTLLASALIVGAVGAITVVKGRRRVEVPAVPAQPELAPRRM